MMCRVHSSWAALALFLSPAIGFGQGTQTDYDRAAQLGARFRDKVLRGNVQPHWQGGDNLFWYRNSLGDGAKEFILVDAGKGKKGPAFDAVHMAKALAAKLGREVKPDRLPFDDIEVRDGGAVVRFQIGEMVYRYEKNADSVKDDDKPLTRAEPQTRPRPRRPREGAGNSSPDGQWTASFRDGNLFLRPKDSKEESQLTRDGRPGDGFGGSVWWAPDSKKLVVFRTKDAPERQVAFVESSPRDQLQPKLQTIGYRKPGDPLPVSKPCLFDAEAKKQIPVSDELFPTPWSIDRLHWDKDSSRFLFLYNQRGHQVMRVVAVDAATGRASAIVDETCKTFFDYAHKLYLRYLDATREIVWMSERDGWNHLYLIDSRTGKVKNAITHGAWVVRAVDELDEEKREVWFQAGGIDPAQDPYYIHFARVRLDGTGLVRLTEGDGTHTVSYSPDRRFLIDTYSRVDLAPVAELRRVEDGKRIMELEAADVGPLRAAGWRPPERFTAKGRDGKTDVFGVIHYPTNFDPKKKYPVIEDIYAGPQGAFVPKSFRPVHGSQSLAELGFIVVKLDGMGTSHRSKAFHDVCWKNLGDAGFPDRILWIRAAAEKRPYMDLTRVGIYGTSAGGQSALGGLLFHPEFHQVGVAVCGCHDNRMDKIWWNELWMSWPVGPHYAEQSNVTNAKNLKGKLFLIVGEADRNVDPASTMQVVNALIRANKDFDLLVIPGGGHGIGGPYGVRRMHDFLVRHLLGVEPRAGKKG